MKANLLRCSPTPIRALAVALLSLAIASPVTAGEDFLGEHFEEFTGIPMAAAEPIADDELDELRGGFLVEGVYFNFEYSLFVGTSDPKDLVFENPDGTPAEISGGAVEGGFINDNPAVVVNDQATGESVRVLANVGGGAFANSNGIFSIVQVPGNYNTVISQIMVNLVILEATPSNLAGVAGRLKQ
jgi:hypothetical protein